MLLAILAAGGCDRGDDSVKGSGVPKTETRGVAEFDQLEFSGAGTLEITIGPLQPLEITADDNILPLLSTEVRNRRLYIKPDRGISPETPVVIKATVPDMRDLLCSGACSVAIEKLKNEHLSVDLGGTGTIVVSGETAKLVLVVAGAGSVDCSRLMADNVNVDLSGVGSASVHAVKELDVTIAGVGTVEYSGDPKVTKQIRGIGALTKRE